MFKCVRNAGPPDTEERHGGAQQTPALKDTDPFTWYGLHVYLLCEKGRGWVKPTQEVLSGVTMTIEETR